MTLTPLDLLLILLVIVFCLWIYKRQEDLRRLLPFSPRKAKTRILSVVAGDNLDMSEIERSLYSTDIEYNLLNYSAVTQDSILAELDKQITVFEISSHGLNGSFRLGNTVLPASWLSNVLGQYKSLECVLLLYCNSYLDLNLLSQSKAFVIGLVGDVEDSACITFARHFYFFLNKQFDYKEAFERARLHLKPSDFSKFLYSGGK